MKKIISILLVAILMVACLAGCGEKRALYSGIDMSKYVEAKDYLGIKVDTKSDEFAEYYNEVLNMDAEDNSLYKEVKEGAVKDGDTINLDYSGKVDGVVFDGGTAEDQELVIGSGTFIDDFEEELIGAKVGETRDVTAKFPDNYSNSPDLAGKEAVFTCTINYIKAPMTEEEAYKEMDFDSVDAYKENITERAAQNYILNVVCDAAKIKDYPENDTAILTDAMFEVYVAQFKSAYGADIEEVLASQGVTIEQFKASDFKTNVVDPMMNVNMVMYYIFDAEKLELLDSTLESQEVEQEVIAESYAVQDTVLDYLYENAEIK